MTLLISSIRFNRKRKGSSSVCSRKGSLGKSKATQALLAWKNSKS
jgi:hypothetical protein